MPATSDASSDLKLSLLSSMKPFAAFPLALALLMARRMIVVGVLPITDTQLQESQNDGASGNTGVAPGSNFSALLFLILGNLQVPAKSMAGAVEANNIPAAVPMMDQVPADVGRENVEPQSQATTPTPDDSTFARLSPDAALRIASRWSINRENEDLPSAAEISESHDQHGETAGAIETQLFHAVTMQIQDRNVEAAVSPTAIVRGVENESADIEAQRSAVSRSQAPAPQAYTLESGASHQNIDMSGAFQRFVGANDEATRVIAPTEATFIADTATVSTPATVYEPELPGLHTPGSVKSPINRTAKTTQHEAPQSVTQVLSNEFTPGEAYARTKEMTAYAGDAMTPAVSNPRRGRIALEDNGLKLNVQLEAQTSNTAQDAALAATPNGGGEEISTSSHQGDQAGLFQQRFRDSNNQQGQAPFHITGHDPANVFSARAIEVAQEAQARELDWRPLVGHVVGEISGHIRIGKSEAVIRLDPPELGNLKIDLRMEGDKIEARIYAENHDSATLIETHLPELRQALAESRVEHVEVRLENANWSSARGDGQQGRRQEPSERQPHAHHAVKVESNDSKEREPGRPQTVRGAGRVSMWA